jgi:hypothetical protein
MSRRPDADQHDIGKPETGLVKLQATGNVTEGAGGLIQAKTLVAQAGVVPDTEGAAGNTPGQAPTAAKRVASGSVLLGNLNQLGFLSAGNVASVQTDPPKLGERPTQLAPQVGAQLFNRL